MTNTVFFMKKTMHTFSKHAYAVCVAYKKLHKYVGPTV